MRRRGFLAIAAGLVGGCVSESGRDTATSTANPSVTLNEATLKDYGVGRRYISLKLDNRGGGPAATVSARFDLRDASDAIIHQQTYTIGWVPADTRYHAWTRALLIPDDVMSVTVEILDTQAPEGTPENVQTEVTGITRYRTPTPGALGNPPGEPPRATAVAENTGSSEQTTHLGLALTDGDVVLNAAASSVTLPAGDRATKELGLVPKRPRRSNYDAFATAFLDPLF